MANGTHPIHPMDIELEGGPDEEPETIHLPGLTKREHAAIQIAQGLASAGHPTGSVSTAAVRLADDLLEELDTDKSTDEA